MKGNMKITVEVRDDFNAFPVTTTWTYSKDNTFEALEDWIDVFNMILNNQGFHHSTRVGIVDDE